MQLDHLLFFQLYLRSLCFFFQELLSLFFLPFHIGKNMFLWIYLVPLFSFRLLFFFLFTFILFLLKNYFIAFNIKAVFQSLHYFLRVCTYIILPNSHNWYSMYCSPFIF